MHHEADASLPSCFRRFLENRMPCKADEDRMPCQADDEETVHYTEESEMADTPRSRNVDMTIDADGSTPRGRNVDMSIDADGFPVMDEMELSAPSPPPRGKFLNPKTRKVAVVDRRQGQPGASAKASAKTKVTKASAKTMDKWSTISLIRPRASGPTKEANPRLELMALDQATGKRTHVATLHEKGHGPAFAEIGLKLKSRLEEAERDGNPMTKEDAKKLLASWLSASCT